MLCGQLEKKFQKPLDKPLKMWYNKYSQEGETPKDGRTDTKVATKENRNEVFKGFKKHRKPSWQN